MEGRTWELLPEGYRTPVHAETYLLPSTRHEMSLLMAIPIPDGRFDPGIKYLQRVRKSFREKALRHQSGLLDVGRRADQAEQATQDFMRTVESMKEEAHRAVAGVREEAARAVASLSDLFRLGREGLEGQMKAHLAGEPWKGEQIDAEAFRSCFRMVSQTVKGMGLPSEQTEKAKEAIIEEAAEALRLTREAIAMAPGPTDETKH